MSCEVLSLIHNAESQKSSLARGIKLWAPDSTIIKDGEIIRIRKNKFNKTILRPVLLRYFFSGRNLLNLLLDTNLSKYIGHLLNKRPAKILKGPINSNSNRIPLLSVITAVKTHIRIKIFKNFIGANGSECLLS